MADENEIEGYEGETVDYGDAAEIPASKGGSSSAEERAFSLDNCPVYCKRAVNFLEACDIILTGSEEQTGVCARVPQYYHGRQCAYLLDLDKMEGQLKKLGDLAVDAYGTWKGGGSRDLYFKETEYGDFEKVGAIRAGKPPNQPWDLFVHEYRQYHPSKDPGGNDSRLCKRIYAIFGDKSGEDEDRGDPEICGRWALITYEWKGEPFTIKAKPHGNTRNPFKKEKGFIRTKPSTRKRISDRLKEGESRDEEDFMDSSSDTATTPGPKVKIATKGKTPKPGLAQPAPEKKDMATSTPMRFKELMIPPPPKIIRVEVPGPTQIVEPDPPVKTFKERELLRLEKLRLTKELEMLEMHRTWLHLKIDKEHRALQQGDAQVENNKIQLIRVQEQ